MVKNTVCAIFAMVALSYYSGLGSGSIVNLFLAGILLFLFQKVGFSGTRRMHICSGIGAVIYSTMLSLGRIGKTDQSYLDILKQFRDTFTKDEYIKHYTASSGTIRNVLIGIVVFCGMSILIYFVILCILRKISELQKIDIQEKQVVSGKMYAIISVSILICWLPVFLVNYPGILTYDSINQISQGLGDFPLNNHHPVTHTILIKFCYNLGIKLFGNSNAGVAVYTVVQMVIMSMIYSYLIKTLLEYNVNRKICVLIWFFYAVIPINSFYAITMWKNILNAGWTLLFVICLFKFVKEESIRYSTWALLLLSEFLAILFLKNAVYAFVATVPILLLLLKKKRKKTLLLLLPVICSLIITGPIYNFFGVLPGGKMAVYSIPLQHIARVVVDYEEELTDDEVAEIEKLNSLENIKKSYNARHALPTDIVSKEGESYVLNHAASFFKLWLELGIHYPKAYLLAEIDATVGYWYPDIQYFGTMFYGVFENSYGIYAQFEDTPIYSANKMWQTLYYYIPLYGNVFSIGLYFWIMLLTGLIWIYMKMYKYLAILIYPIMLWGTMLVAAPIFSELRYVYSIILVVPSFIAFLLITSHSEQV